MHEVELEVEIRALGIWCDLVWPIGTHHRTAQTDELSASFLSKQIIALLFHK